MSKRDKTIDGIALALSLYSEADPPAIIRQAVAAMDPESIGVLHGITGVLRHALHSKMPIKWVKQIHGDLLDAFECLADINHEAN